MKLAVVLFATALTSIVLPVPGGPYSNTPRGGSMPDDCVKVVDDSLAPRGRTDLFVEIKVSQGKLNSLADFLLLHVQPADICVCHVRLLVSPKHGNGRVGFWRENVNERVRVAMKRNRR
jgi:hypothetical protein